MTNCLETRQVSKFFGGLVAVDKVDLEIPERSIYSIIGPNGAGKTTLFNCISGYYTPEHGSVMYYDEEVQGLSTDNIANLGIARTYQNIRLFKEMSAIENVMIGQQPHLHSTWLDAVLHTKRYSTEERETLEESLRLLDFVGLSHMGDTIARNLPYGAQRRLEIARALANHPKLLLLDEPTAGMNSQETEVMKNFIYELRGKLNLTILLIEHDMRVVMGISDRITVLDHGMKIAEGSPSEIQSNSRVIEAYLGSGTEALTEKYRRKKLQ